MTNGLPSVLANDLYLYCLANLVFHSQVYHSLYQYGSNAVMLVKFLLCVYLMKKMHILNILYSMLNLHWPLQKSGNMGGSYGNSHISHCVWRWSETTVPQSPAVHNQECWSADDLPAEPRPDACCFVVVVFFLLGAGTAWHGLGPWGLMMIRQSAHFLPPLTAAPADTTPIPPLA